MEVKAGIRELLEVAQVLADRVWRREAVQRLICEMKDLTQNVALPAAASS